MGLITFNPRWKEELEAISSEGKLIFMFTMGVPHVYFPDEDSWADCVPLWAKAKWKAYYDGVKQWCAANRVPLSLVKDAYVYEEKK